MKAEQHTRSHEWRRGRRDLLALLSRHERAPMCFGDRLMWVVVVGSWCIVLFAIGYRLVTA